MEVPEIASFARNFGVMVRVRGPDPKGLKMQRHAFHQYRDGITTVSSSGILLPDALGRTITGDKEHCIPNEAVVVTVASVIESFLLPRQDERSSEALTELIPGVQIDIMSERMETRKSSPNKLDSSLCWRSAQLFSMVDVRVSKFSFQLLPGVSPNSDLMEHAWEVGWSLASYSNGFRPCEEPFDVKVEKDLNFSGKVGETLGVLQPGSRRELEKSNTRIAFLRVLLEENMVTPNFLTSTSNTRGDLLLAVGSPFGVLSPLHFFNSISVGSISNICGSEFSSTPLLMADMRCLPGMEGGPVFDKHTRLVGMLTTPLRQKSSGAEVHIIIPWKAIMTACGEQQCHKPPEDNSPAPRLDTGRVITSTFASPLQKAMHSVCLVTTPVGSWASGVLLDYNGLVLTNAHLLEPWRFGKTSAGNKRTLNTLGAHPTHYLEFGSHVRGLSNEQTLALVGVKPVYLSNRHPEEPNVVANYYGHSPIRVRVDHAGSWSWCNATAVYISEGVLDIALLQLDFHEQLHPVVADFNCPSAGSEVFIIGHGLFGPQRDISPSISHGVISKVIKTTLIKESREDVPVMFETTAAVYPGSSGGAIFNTEGRMIGLVTSNTKHGGGTVIPYLNFSIPCAVMEPVFKFSAGKSDFSLVKRLDNPNEQLASIWALMPPLSPKRSVPVADLSHENDNGNKKGARFAKFVAQRRDIFETSAHTDKAGKVLLDYAASKL